MSPRRPRPLREPHGYRVERFENARRHGLPPRLARDALVGGRRAGGLADRGDDTPAVVAGVELEPGDLQGHGVAVPAEHLERERRAGDVLLDYGVVPLGLERGARRGELMLVGGEPHALAAARGAGLDDHRERTAGPRYRSRHIKPREELVRGELGGGHRIRGEVEEQRYVPTRHVRVEPGERGVVLAGGQHGVAGVQHGAAPRLVGGHVHDHVDVGEAGGRRCLATVDQDRLVPRLGGEVDGLRPLQLAADDRQPHVDSPVRGGAAAPATRRRSSVSR